jgi:diguanylate cyclase (GGDEF)-like protein
MEIKLYFRMLQRSWWVIAVTALMAVMVTLLASYFTTPIYRSVSRFIVSPNPAIITGESNTLDSIGLLDKRSIITTYSEILNSPRIYRETLPDVNLTEADVEDYEYIAVVLPDTNILEFSVLGPDAGITTLLANSIGAHAVEYIQNLYPVYDLSLLDPAIVPLEPISPLPLRDAGVALVVGLAIGVALALVRELLRAPIENFMQERRTDAMSTALNRLTFEEKLQEIAFASITDFTLCIVRLEGLTDFIDVLPQPSMQNILRSVNQTLKNQLRGNDLVGRWSDVEFAVLLSETSGDAALNTMGRVRMALSVPIRIDVSGDDLYMKPTIGVAEYRVGDTAMSLVKNTNWALEIAKKGQGLYLLRATEQI